MTDNNQFSNFFYPRNIAVVGVSPGQNNLGKVIVMNCLRFGFQGEILSVGAREGVVFGQQIHHSLEDIDREIDVAIILTPAKTIPGILEQCGRKGIKWVVVESSGFSEMGEEGKAIEQTCLEIAQRFDIRFIGPNGIGVINMEVGLVMPFVPLQGDIRPGSVSILAQSGGVGLSYLGFLAEENIGINKFVSMGNKLNVNENDLLEFYVQDEGTKIILIYLEGFKNGRRFLEIASKSKKPILVHKSNRFKASAQIAHSHTAALFADDTLVNSALEQAGCVRVNTMDDAMDYTKSLTLPPLKGNRLAVVSRSGGHAVIAADACAHYGFDLPSFPKEFLKKIEARLRAHVIRLQNPLDLGDLFDLEFYEYIVDQLLKRKDVDGVLLGHGYNPKGPEQAASRSLIKKVAQLVERYQKPVAMFIFTESAELDHLRRQTNIPVFSAPENAMRAFYLSHKWASRTPVTPDLQPTQDIDTRAAGEILTGAEGRGHLFLGEANDLLRTYGFKVPDYALARSQDGALRLWRDIQAPVVMKINKPHFSHKSDAGAVRLDINSEEGVKAVFNDFKALAGTDDLEVLIQRMVSNGREVILGGKQDPVFGPVILFGLGGIFVEALEDVVWRVAPIDLNEAGRMIHEIRGHKILSGMRGARPWDVDGIADALVKLSQLLNDFSTIKEIDINPVMVGSKGEGAQALDARVILRIEN